MARLEVCVHVVFWKQNEEFLQAASENWQEEVEAEAVPGTGTFAVYSNEEACAVEMDSESVSDSVMLSLCAAEELLHEMEIDKKELGDDEQMETQMVLESQDLMRTPMIELSLRNPDTEPHCHWMCRRLGMQKRAIDDVSGQQHSLRSGNDIESELLRNVDIGHSSCR